MTQVEHRPVNTLAIVEITKSGNDDFNNNNKDFIEK
jgi:hypothetical protein